MIDVTFLLLIFFLCLEFKTLESKLATNLPKEVGPNPTAAEPIEKLDLRVELVNWGREQRVGRRLELEGHRVRYYLGARRIADKARLEVALRKAARKQITDRQGRRVPRPITIKADVGVCYQDVTEVIDVALDANFETVTFGGGAGPRQNR